MVQIAFAKLYYNSFMLPIATVVISYRRPQMVLSCLQKLLALPDAPQKIFLVDNSPDDGTANLVLSQYPQVSIINAGGNRGFAGGNNLGIQAAIMEGFPFILLLNDDAELTAGSLQILYDAISTDVSVGAVGPVVYYGDGRKVWAAGGSVIMVSGVVSHSLFAHHKNSYETGYVIACAVLYRSEALARTGLFDERFFMYYEDSDLGVRLRQAGYRNLLVPAAGAWHHVSEDLSSRQKTPTFVYYLQRNRILFVRKHAAGSYSTMSLIWRSLWELAVLLAKGNLAGAVAGWQGLNDGLRGRSGIWR